MPLVPPKLYTTTAAAAAAAAIPAPRSVCIAAWKRCARCSLVDIFSAPNATPRSVNKIHMLTNPLEIMVKYSPTLIDDDGPLDDRSTRTLRTLWEHPLFEMVYTLITGTPENTFICRIQATPTGEIMQMTLGMNPSKLHLMASVWPYSSTKDWSPESVRALCQLIDRWHRIDFTGASKHMLKCDMNPRHHMVPYKPLPLAKIHKVSLNVFCKNSRENITETVSNMDNVFVQKHVFQAGPPGEAICLPLAPVDGYMIGCPDALSKDICAERSESGAPLLRIVGAPPVAARGDFIQRTRVMFFHKANAELYIALLCYWVATRGRYPCLVIVCAKEYIPVWRDLVARYVPLSLGTSSVKLVCSMSEDYYAVAADPRALFILHNIFPSDAKRLARGTSFTQHFFIVTSERFVQWKYLTYDVCKTVQCLVPPSDAPVCAVRLLAALTVIWRPFYTTNGPMTFICSPPTIRMIMVPSNPAVHTCAVHETSIVASRLPEHTDLMDKDNLCNLLYPPFYETLKNVESVILSHINPYAHGPVHYRLCAECNRRWVNTRDADHCYIQADFLADRARVHCMDCTLLKFAAEGSSSCRQKHTLVYRRSYGWDLVPADISTFFNSLLYNTIVPALKNPKNTNMIYIVFHNSSEISHSMQEGTGTMRAIFETVLCRPVEMPIGPMTRTRIKQLGDLAKGIIPVPAFFPEPNGSASDIDIVNAPCDPGEFSDMIKQRICIPPAKQRRLTLLLVSRSALKYTHLYNVFNTRLKKIFIYGYSPILQFLPSARLCTQLSAVYYYVPSQITYSAVEKGDADVDEECRCITDQLVDMKEKRILLSKKALVQLGGERQMSYPNWSGTWLKPKQK